MKKTTPIVASMILFLMLVIGGCTEDDCVTCPSESEDTPEQIGVIIGDARLSFPDDNLIMNAKIFPFDLPIPVIDSILVDDKPAYITLNPVHHYYYVEYYTSIDSGAYSSGDSIEIEIFAHSSISVAKVRLLQWQGDIPIIIDWSTIPLNNPGAADTNFVHPDSDISIAWHPRESADFYKGYVNIKDTSGTIVNRIEIMQADTNLIISAPHDDLIEEVYLRIASATGPHPDDNSGNVIGGVIKGVITSYSAYREARFIYAGSEP